MSDARTVMDAIDRDPNLSPTDRATVAEALGFTAYLGHNVHRVHRVSGRTYPTMRVGALDEETQ